MKDNTKTGLNIITQFLTIGIGTFVNMILGLFSTPIITRIVDPDIYGQLSMFSLYSSIAVMVLCLGLDQALVRFYYLHEEGTYKQALLKKCIVLPVLITILFSIIIIIVSYLKIIEFEFTPFVMALLCIYTLLQLIYRFSLLVVRLEKDSKLYSILQVIQKIVYIAINLIFCLLLRKHYLYILISGTIISLFTVVLVSIISKKNVWDLKKSNINNCEVSQKELLKYATPFIISLGINTLFQGIDKIFLNYYCTYAEIGIYSSTMSIVNIFAIVQTAFNALWGPMAIEHYTKCPEDTEFHKNANHYITVVMFFMGICIILFKDLFVLLLGEKYRQATYILPFLILNPIMYTISETTVVGLDFKKKSTVQILISVTVCLTNIFGNYLLVPKFGPRGAAISTGLSYVVFYYMRTILGSKYYKVDFELGKFSLLTIIILFYCLYNTFNSFSIISVFGGIISLLVLFCLYKKETLFCLNKGFEYVKEVFNRNN